MEELWRHMPELHRRGVLRDFPCILDACLDSLEPIVKQVMGFEEDASVAFVYDVEKITQTEGELTDERIREFLRTGVISLDETTQLHHLFDEQDRPRGDLRLILQVLSHSPKVCLGST